MEYEESNLAKSFPTRFKHGPFKVLEWKWFNSRSCVGVVLVFDLLEKRLKGFLASPSDFFLGKDQEEEAVKDIVDHGCTLPTDMVIVIFTRYFAQEGVFRNLDRDFKMFMAFTELLDERKT
jgi:hypothetical protein